MNGTDKARMICIVTFFVMAGIVLSLAILADAGAFN